MVTSINLLIVEDDDGQFETYSDMADELLRNNKCEFVLTREKDATAAKQALLSKDFDAAIVDLNLNANNPDEASGNEILIQIIETHRFPVFVVSGNLGKLNQEIIERESLFLKFYNRDKPNSEIFGEIQKIWNTGITKILGGRGMIENKLTDIFWKHLANDLDVWIQNNNASEKALLRYAVSHLSEYLDQPSVEDGYYYSDAEFYIKPPIQKVIATGDIAENKDGSRFIVLSPACDVAVRGQDDSDNPIINAKRLTLAKLITVDRQSFIENNVIKVGDNTGSREKTLEKIIHGQQDKYIFLPEYKELKASIADFQNLHTVEFNDYTINYKRIATVASPFLKDIQSRFSSYYGRQGQPDLNKKELVKKHKPKLSYNP
ncbi:MAG: response regulator [Methylobacter sp.]|nr:MAG: response regulator [Methylobacter sp.]